MRFISNDKVNPLIGETRIIKKFLLFPKCLQNLDGFFESRWFETAIIEEIYEERGVYISADPGYSSEVDWWENRWVN